MSNYEWTPLIRNEYDPIKAGSIDGTDSEPHDNAIIRALNCIYRPNKGVVGDPNVINLFSSVYTNILFSVHYLLVVLIEILLKKI